MKTSSKHEKLSARRPFWLPLALAGVLVGCGGGTSVLKEQKLYETRGKVELADGKPLPSGRVEFVPLKATVAETIGEIGPDGTFSIKTHDLDRCEGAAPGEYKIRICPGPRSLVNRNGKQFVDRTRLPFHARYLSVATSELVATVKPEANQLRPFRLTR